jgi:Asp/Glu/hydantoin racemase
MSSTLTSIQQRVSVLLADLTHLNYSNELITEGIRLAVLEYSRACGTDETLTGLDGASATSIPENDCGIIVLGASGFTASCKTLDRQQQFNLEDGSPEAVSQLGQRLVQRFDRLLGTVRSGRMRSMEVQVWGEGWGSV